MDFELYTEGVNALKSAIAGLESIGDFNFQVKAILAFAKISIEDSFSQSIVSKKFYKFIFRFIRQ